MRKEEIEEMADLLQHSSVTKLEIAGEGWSLRLDRELVKPKEGSVPGPPAEPPPPVPAEQPPKGATVAPGTVVDAPMVGVFHHNKPPVALGRPIRAGDILGQIEALTLLSEVHSPIDGQIVEMLIDDGQPVEYGQPLFILQAVKS